MLFFGNQKENKCVNAQIMRQNTMSVKKIVLNRWTVSHGKYCTGWPKKFGTFLYVL